ncbi:UNVERIFIED_CONTAM: hypothetical protein FKN15_012905 [Acipenser sinensis]
MHCPDELLLIGLKRPPLSPQNGNTALAIARRLGYISVVDTLKVVTEEVITTTTLGYTPVIVACHYGNIKMVNFLLQHSANVNAKTKNGYTPLHQAAQQGHTHIINTLLQHGAKPNAVTVNGNTALAIARRLGYISVVDTLKVVTEEVITTTTTVTEKHKLNVPETMTEVLEVSDEEGDDTMTGDGGEYLRAEDLKELGDDSLPGQYLDGMNYLRFSLEGGRSESSDRSHTLSQGSYLRDSAMIEDMIAATNHQVSALARDPEKDSYHLSWCTENLDNVAVSSSPIHSGPVIVEIPHFAALRGKERELVVLRSETGESWKEHHCEFSEEELNEILNGMDEDCRQIQESVNFATQMYREIICVPYMAKFVIFAKSHDPIEARLRCFCMTDDKVDKTLEQQENFTEVARSRDVEVLEGKPIYADCFGNLVPLTKSGQHHLFSFYAFKENRLALFIKVRDSTQEPCGRLSFMKEPRSYRGLAHHAICNLNITLPAYSKKLVALSDNSALPTLSSTLLLGTERNLIQIRNKRKRFWLIDCRQIQESVNFATQMYREIICVPYMAKFVIFAKSHDPIEARLRCFCMTDDKVDKTLEQQENFTEVARSRDVEVLEGKPIYADCFGNLVPLTKSGQHHLFSFYAFKENRLALFIKVRDSTQEPCGRLSFMKEPRSYRGLAHHAICNLNITLPAYSKMPLPEDIFDMRPIWDESVETQIQRIPDENVRNQREDPQDDEEKSEERLAIIADHLGFSWTELARELEFTEDQIHQIRVENPNSLLDQSHALLKYWMERDGKRATDNNLIKTLTKINRMDIVHLIETSSIHPSQELTSRTYAEIEQTIALDHSEGQASQETALSAPLKEEAQSLRLADCVRGQAKQVSPSIHEPTPEPSIHEHRQLIPGHSHEYKETTPEQRVSPPCYTESNPDYIETTSDDTEPSPNHSQSLHGHRENTPEHRDPAYEYKETILGYIQATSVEREAPTDNKGATRHYVESAIDCTEADPTNRAPSPEDSEPTHDDRESTTDYKMVTSDYIEAASDDREPTLDYRDSTINYDNKSALDYRESTPDHRESISQCRESSPDHIESTPKFKVVIPDYKEHTPGDSASTPDYREPTPGYTASTPDYREPTPGYTASTPDYREPTTDYTASTPDYREPTPGDTASTPDYREPTPGDTASTPDYREPTPGYTASTPDYREPTPGYTASTPDYREPTPGDTASTPDYREPTPGDTASTPDYRWPTPGYTASTPDYREPTPGDTASTPDYREPTPGDTASTPDYRGPTPGDTASTPDYREPTPGYTASTPDYREPTPGYTASTPDYREPTTDYTVAISYNREETPDYKEDASDDREHTLDYRDPAINYTEGNTNEKEHTPNYRESTPDHRESISQCRESSPDHIESTPNFKVVIPDYKEHTPGDTASTPDYREPTPGDTASTPDYRGPTPGDTASTPDYREPIPGDTASTPDYREPTPGDTASTPDYRGPTPGDTASTPDYRKPTPGDTASTPDYREPTPGDTASTPDYRDPTPGDTASTPDYREPTPGYTASTPDYREPTTDYTVAISYNKEDTPDYKEDASDDREHTLDYRDPAINYTEGNTNEKEHTPNYRESTLDHREPISHCREFSPDHVESTPDFNMVTSDNKDHTPDYSASSPDYKEPITDCIEATSDDRLDYMDHTINHSEDNTNNRKPTPDYRDSTPDYTETTSEFLDASSDFIEATSDDIKPNLDYRKPTTDHTVATPDFRESTDDRESSPDYIETFIEASSDFRGSTPDYKEATAKEVTSEAEEPIVQEPEEVQEKHETVVPTRMSGPTIVESLEEQPDRRSKYLDDESLEREIAEELGELEDSSDEEEVVTTRVIRRRVVIQADDMPDFPPESVTEEQYTDEHGHVVVKKVTRKIIRRYISPDGTEKEEVIMHGPQQDPICIEEGDGYSKVVKRTVLKSDSDQTEVTRKIIRRYISPDGTEKEEVIMQGPQQDSLCIEEGDGYSKVVKRTVLKSDSDQTEVTFSEPQAFAGSLSEFQMEPVHGRKVSKVIKTTVVQGDRMEKHLGDATLATDLPSAKDDFEQALSYAGGSGKVHLPCLVEQEIVKEDGSVIKRTRMSKASSQKRTVVKDAEGKHVHVEQLEDVPEALQQDDLQHDLHQLLCRFCTDDRKHEAT